MSPFYFLNLLGLIRFFFSGWIDPVIQNKAYIDFATNAPGHGALVTQTVIQKMNASYYGAGGCLEEQQACIAGGNATTTAVDQTCAQANNDCVRPSFFEVRVGVLSGGHQVRQDRSVGDWQTQSI